MTGALPRHTLVRPDGRRLHVYGELRGSLPPGGTTRGDVSRLHRRWDALSGTWVAISPARNTRPGGAPAPATGAPACPLCPGGPEVPFSYQAAVFDNAFPTFAADAPSVGDDPWLARSTGTCEVVLYTQAHVGSLATLPPEDLGRVVAVWCDRSDELWADPAHAAVMIFENRGAEIGATLSHPHGQIYAFPHLPPLLAQRVAVLDRHRAEHHACLTCAVLERDDRSPERQVAGNPTFAVTVPFAARWPYEVRVRARHHGVRRLGDLDGPGRSDLAVAVQDVVRRFDALWDFELPYMMAILEAPPGADDWHLTVEFLPPHRSADKLKVRASVETVTGLFINDTVPEESAARLAATAPEPSGRTVEVPVVVRIT